MKQWIVIDWGGTGKDAPRSLANALNRMEEQGFSYSETIVITSNQTSRGFVLGFRDLGDVSSEMTAVGPGAALVPYTRPHNQEVEYDDPSIPNGQSPTPQDGPPIAVRQSRAWQDAKSTMGRAPATGPRDPFAEAMQSVPQLPPVIRRR